MIFIVRLKKIDIKPSKVKNIFLITFKIYQPNMYRVILQKLKILEILQVTQLMPGTCLPAL